MTPAQLEHLRLIKAHLETLLEGAKKRTPGRWQQGDSMHEMNLDMVYRQPDVIGRSAGIPAYGRNSGLSREQDQYDAAFIASCAGNAEAGWKSTLAAIKAFSFEATCDSYIAQEDAEALLLAILAVWPIESLQK